MKRRRIPSILKWTGIAIFGLAVIYAVLLIGSTIRLRRAYAALAKDGRPMRMEDVIPPRVLDSENAALPYQIARLRFRLLVGDQVLLSDAGRQADALLRGYLDPNEQEELDRWLQSPFVEQFLAAVEEGTQRPRCRFDLDYDGGLGIVFEHVPWIHDVCLVLCAKADMQARQGQRSTAWKTLEAALRLADALRSEPFLGSQTQRAVLIRRMAPFLQSLCQTSPPDLQQMGRLDDLLKGYDDRGSYIAGIDGERLLYGEWVFRASPRTRFHWAMEIYSVNHHRSLIKMIPVLFEPTLQLDHAVYLDVMRQYAQMVGTPYSPQDTEVERRLWAAIPWYCPLASNLSMPIGKANWVVRPKAEIRITRIGLAALRYGHEHGAYPGSLDVLGLQDVVDPFNGRPLIYRPEGEGFVVYSVGPDQKDDGGVDGWDIVWRYPGPRQPQSRLVE